MSLDGKTLALLKEKLLGEKSRLEAELAIFAKPTKAAGDYETRMENIGTDPEENATEVEEYVDKLGLETSLESQLKDVSEALVKMDQGVYGVCERTGKDISVERLMAYPGARTAL